MAEGLAAALVDLRRDAVLEEVSARAKKGEDPLAILADCRQGMTMVGEPYQKGDYYLAEMMLAAEIFKGATAVLQPYLDNKRPVRPLVPYACKPENFRAMIETGRTYQFSKR